MATPPVAFLEENLSPGSVRIALFGKHPAAADHLEDMGLASSSLAAFKQGFYVDGIGECLAKQAWLKDLGAVDSIPYNHHLLCLGRSGVLAARFQHSADATGRRQFPLVLAAHLAELTGSTAELGQFLESHLTAAIAARGLEELRATHAQAQSHAQEIAQGWSAIQTVEPARRRAWLQGIQAADDSLGLWRIVHALSPKGAAAGRVRVPLASGTIGSAWLAAALWATLARTIHENPDALVTIFWKAGGSYADLVFSPPNMRALLSLFAGEASQPLTSAVPFNVSADLKAHAQPLLDKWQAESLLVQASPVANSSSLLNKVCKGWRSLLSS